MSEYIINGELHIKCQNCGKIVPRSKAYSSYHCTKECSDYVIGKLNDKTLCPRCHQPRYMCMCPKGGNS